MAVGDRHYNQDGTSYFEGTGFGFRPPRPSDNDSPSGILDSFAGDVSGATNHSLGAFGQLGQGNLGGAGSQVGQFANDLGHMFGLVKNHNMPDPAAPPPPPTLGQATLFGLGQQLSHEQRMAAASTTLTGGAGLLDEPTTASQVLLGS